MKKGSTAPSPARVADRVLEALAKAIEKDPQAALVAEFRQLLPVAADPQKLKDLEERSASALDRLAKLEQEQEATNRTLRDLLQVNGMERVQADEIGTF